MKRVLLPVIILIGGFGLAGLIIATGPTLEQKAPPPNSPLVRYWTAKPQTVRMTTIAHGTVLPRTESELVPEVSGRVMRVSDAMVSGGFFKQGELLFQIETLDYEVALEQAKAAIASAQSELTSAKRAHARQLDLARKQSTSESLRDDALNRLNFAEASLRETKARLSKAQRDLTRTKVTAPYDGRVRSERVDVGQFVSRGAPVAKLYATDFAEVRLPVHDEELAYLKLPLDGLQALSGQGFTAILRARFAGQDHTWESKIVRTEGELDPQTRMINVIAQVDAPYESSAGRPPLAVGLFVEAEILGTRVDNVYVLPRSAIQPNDQVYVIGEDNRLEFRDVDILRVVNEDVYVVSGFATGEVICLSAVSNAVRGMSVRRVENAIASNVPLSNEGESNQRESDQGVSDQGAL